MRRTDHAGTALPIAAVVTVVLALSCGEATKPDSRRPRSGADVDSGDGRIGRASLYARSSLAWPNTTSDGEWAQGAPLDDDDCIVCHEREASQWSGSRHHTSFTNVDFVRAFAREAMPFCRDCHAPGLTRLGGTTPSTLQALTRGVACLDCHVERGRPSVVLAGPASVIEGSVQRPPPHAVARRDSFGTDVCATCHEFAFPDASHRPRGTMMQTTSSEHRASQYADVSCASCHMRRPDGVGSTGRTDHGVSTTREGDAHRRAVRIQARLVTDTLLVELLPERVGHAYPTGDLFRRVEIGVTGWRAGARVFERRHFLDREFPPRRLANGRRHPDWDRPVGDDRLRGPTTMALSVGDEGASSPVELVEWWVDYERVDARDDADPARSTVASEVRLASGVVVSTPPPASP